MKITSIIAIYAMFWVLAAFLVLPFGIRTHEEAGEATIKGQAHSAPANFQPRRIARRDVPVDRHVCTLLCELRQRMAWAARF